MTLIGCGTFDPVASKQAVELPPPPHFMSSIQPTADLVKNQDARTTLAQCEGDLKTANQRLDFSRGWYNARRNEYARKK